MTCPAPGSDATPAAAAVPAAKVGGMLPAEPGRALAGVGGPGADPTAKWRPLAELLVDRWAG